MLIYTLMVKFSINLFTVKRFAEEVIKPKVKEMDKAGAVDPSILSSLFEQGFMGIEVPSSFNGSEASFASSIILIGTFL
jgi:short/branched chain acyl-CoA dehydrogenase